MPRADVLFADPVFQSFVGEAEALGWRLSAGPQPGSEPYMVIGGRSNRRWWLLPLANRRVTESGMAMFQPARATSGLAKAAGTAAARLGLAPILARRVVHLAGECRLAEIFGGAGLAYALFTGTDGPHRKTTVQAMDRQGDILGYVKVARTPAVVPLLDHEAKVLDRLAGLDLRAARVPRVLFHGDIGGATVLATDTRRTRFSRSSVRWTSDHATFTSELVHKTSRADASRDWLTASLQPVLDSCRERMGREWPLLDSAVSILARDGWELGSPCLCHGDFKPANSFGSDSVLYVFDWEQATDCGLAGQDAAQFLFTVSRYASASEWVNTSWTLRELVRTEVVSSIRSGALLLLAWAVKRYCESPAAVDPTGESEQRVDASGSRSCVVRASMGALGYPVAQGGESG